MMKRVEEQWKVSTCSHLGVELYPPFIRLSGGWIGNYVSDDLSVHNTDNLAKTKKKRARSDWSVFIYPLPPMRPYSVDSSTCSSSPRRAGPKVGDMSACGVTVLLLYVLTGAGCRDSNEAALNDLIAPQNGFCLSLFKENSFSRPTGRHHLDIFICVNTARS
jgi:hypothetical protein